jgi:hypothetical protein
MTRLLRFRLTERIAYWTGAAVLLAFAAFAWRIIPPTVSAARGSFLAFSDFFGQWSFGLFARFGPIEQIYDGDALHRFQLTLEPALRQKFPFPYPPHYLFTVWPLSWMPYGVAYLVWDGVSLLLFIWACFGFDTRSKYRWFVVLAPATVICLVQGQSGLLSSAFLVGGLRLASERPAAGGILLGMATIKPNLGLLVPLALIAGRRWRTLVAACVTTAALVAASGLVFGWTLWLAWWNALVEHPDYLDRNVGNYLKPGVMANLVLFGMPLADAHLVQAALGVVVSAVVFRCFWRRFDDLSIAVLQSGTFLAVPYTFRYDMPLLVNAILLLVRDRERTRRSVGPIEAGVIVLGLLMPAITQITTRFFYLSGLSLISLFALALWRWSRVSSPWPGTDGCGGGREGAL